MFEWVKNKVSYSPKKDFRALILRKGAVRNAISWYFTRSSGKLYPRRRTVSMK